jgi:hypothetical protein
MGQYLQIEHRRGKEKITMRIRKYFELITNEDKVYQNKIYTGRVSQVVEHQLSKCEALSSNPSTVKTKYTKYNI